MLAATGHDVAVSDIDVTVTGNVWQWRNGR